MRLVPSRLVEFGDAIDAGLLDTLKQDTDLRSTLEEELAEAYEEFDELADEWPEGDDQPELLSPEDVSAIEREISDLREFRDLAAFISQNANPLGMLNARDALRVLLRKLRSRKCSCATM